LTDRRKAVRRDRIGHLDHGELRELRAVANRLALQVGGVPLLTGTVAVFHAAVDALGELVLSAILMPAVSPNIFATFAFLSALSVVCHCCLSEKW
jgi:hypothetical protein